jgi:hypothetical protein
MSLNKIIARGQFGLQVYYWGFRRKSTGLKREKILDFRVGTTRFLSFVETVMLLIENVPVKKSTNTGFSY